MSDRLRVKPPVKLLATTLSILATVGACTLAAPVSLAAGPVAQKAGTHPARARRAHHSACTRRASHRCRQTRMRTRLKLHRAAKRTHAAARKSHTVAASAGTPGAAQQQAAPVVAALAVPCANTELTPEEGNIPLIRASVLCLINRERAQNGVAPLVDDEKLETAAEGHCSELIADDYFAHISPTGETPVDRIRATDYIPGPSAGYIIGENLAWGTYDLATPQAIVSAWIASPEHLANILEAKYTETGIGVTPAVPSSLAAGAPGATYAQEFGVIIH